MVYKAIKYRGHNAYDQEAASNEAMIPASEYGPSLTDQSMAKEADINYIVEQFGITGQLPSSPNVPSYGDYTEVTDYRSALHAVMEAQDRFLELPPTVRARFDNDPQLFLEFAVDPSNLDAMRQMGLAVPKEVANGSSQGPGGSVSGSPGAQAPGVAAPPGSAGAAAGAPAGAPVKG